jgi:nucleoside-diphosphate-sugar epimerase
MEVATIMRVFLAGASGVIGRPLIGLLKAAGHEVIGTTRRTDRADMLRKLGAEPVILDAYDRDAVLAAVSDARPDAIINQLTDLSGMDLDSTNRLRRDGTRNLVDAAKAAGVGRMITQSITMLYEPGDELATEAEPLNGNAPEPWNQQVAALAAMEDSANELPESVILRYGLFYDATTGFNGDGFMARLIQSSSLPANDNVTSFIHVDDAAEATMLALDWPAGVYNIVDDEPVEARVWVPAAARANGWPVPQRVAGRDPIMSRGASNGKARRVGWSPRHPSWRSGLPA